MTQLAYLDELQIEAPARPPFSPAATQVLQELRFAAMRCRATARLDLFDTQARLSLERDIPAAGFRDALLRCLPDAMTKRPEFRAPGSAEITFDEAWILRGLERAQAGDLDGLKFLVARRVRHDARRTIEFFLRGFADRLDTF